MGTYGGRMRCVGDPGVLKISFQPYLNTKEWAIPFKVYWNALDYICWYETDTKTVWVPGLLDTDDFPFERNASRDTVDKEWSGSNQIFNLNGQGVWRDKWLEHMRDSWNMFRSFVQGDPKHEQDFQNEDWTTTLTRYPC